MHGHERAAADTDPGCARVPQGLEPRFEAPPGESVRPVDARDLYRRLFLPAGDGGSRDDACLALHDLARGASPADAVLERAWLILGTAYIDRQLQAGVAPDRVDRLAALLREYARVLHEAYFDTGAGAPTPPARAAAGDPDGLALVGRFRGYLDATPPAGGPRVYGCYRGVPVECAASVEAVGNEQVGMRVSAVLAGALARRGDAIVHSPAHGFTMRAHARHVDRPHRIVWLGAFERHDGDPERRAPVRIEPGEFVEVRVRAGGREHTGRLIDLSVAAFAAYFRHVDPGVFVEGADADCEIVLPLRGDRPPCEIALRGWIGCSQSGLNGDASASRLVVHLQTHTGLYERLSEYIAERQTRILAELAGH